MLQTVAWHPWSCFENTPTLCSIFSPYLLHVTCVITVYPVTTLLSQYETCQVCCRAWHVQRPPHRDHAVLQPKSFKHGRENYHKKENVLSTYRLYKSTPEVHHICQLPTTLVQTRHPFQQLSAAMPYRPSYNDATCAIYCVTEGACIVNQSSTFVHPL